MFLWFWASPPNLQDWIGIGFNLKTKIPRCLPLHAQNVHDQKIQSDDNKFCLSLIEKLAKKNQFKGPFITNEREDLRIKYWHSTSINNYNFIFFWVFGYFSSFWECNKQALKTSENINKKQVSDLSPLGEVEWYPRSVRTGTPSSELWLEPLVFSTLTPREWLMLLTLIEEFSISTDPLEQTNQTL